MRLGWSVGGGRRRISPWYIHSFSQGKKKGKERGKSKGRRGDSDDEEDAAHERKLQNQFSFVERATQTMNNAMKVGKRV